MVGLFAATRLVSFGNRRTVPSFYQSNNSDKDDLENQLKDAQQQIQQLQRKLQESVETHGNCRDEEQGKRFNNPNLTSNSTISEQQGADADSLRLAWIEQKLLENEMAFRRLPSSLDDNRVSCRIAIENKVEQNLDTLISVALRFPLPWTLHTHNCTFPAIVDYFLVEAADAASPSRIFKTHYEANYQGKEFVRSDGIPILFGSVFHQYPANYGSLYPFKIGASCDRYNFFKWLREGDVGNRYCLLQELSMARQLLETESNRDVMDRICQSIDPTFGGCFILLASLPQFANRLPSFGRQQHHQQQQNLRICIPLGRINALHRLPWFKKAVSKWNQQQRSQSTHSSRVDIRFIARKFGPMETTMIADYLFQSKLPGLHFQFTNTSSPHQFVEWYREVSQCHGMISLANEDGPLDQPGWGVPPAVAYRIPSVLPRIIAELYAEHFSAPAWPYNSSESLLDGISDLMRTIQDGVYVGPERR